MNYLCGQFSDFALDLYVWFAFTHGYYLLVLSACADSRELLVGYRVFWSWFICGLRVLMVLIFLFGARFLMFMIHLV